MKGNTLCGGLMKEVTVDVTTGITVFGVCQMLCNKKDVYL